MADRTGGPGGAGTAGGTGSTGGTGGTGSAGGTGGAGKAAGGGTGDQWRVDFDAEVVFSNGGALQTQGFRLDIPGDAIGDEELGELLVRHLGLLMVGATKITRKRLIREPHKGSRNTAAGPARPRTTDLTSPTTRATWPPAEPPATEAALRGDGPGDDGLGGDGPGGDELGGDGPGGDGPGGDRAEGDELGGDELGGDRPGGDGREGDQQGGDGSGGGAGPGGRRAGGGPELADLVDLPVVLVRLTGAAEPVADRLALAPFRLAGQAVVIETGRPDGPYLTEEAVALLAGQGAVLVATDGTCRTGAVADALGVAGVPLVTGLTGLAALPAEGARLHVVPTPNPAYTRVYAVTPPPN
ncbi:hypothetical protein [Streptomyces sp. NBC_00239]|uniref:hypothetical protein n=1 Tax=Streptomyces sp. NBC_00239 TaxID=2903640 RepID=UPI002E2ACCC8|nr:hypothetical protein [Streptomyces sp. NBC_00239]